MQDSIESFQQYLHKQNPLIRNNSDSLEEPTKPQLVPSYVKEHKDPELRWEMKVRRELEHQKQLQKKKADRKKLRDEKEMKERIRKDEIERQEALKREE